MQQIRVAFLETSLVPLLHRLVADLPGLPAQAKASTLAKYTAMSTRAQPESRTAYKAFAPITTRWSDNDVYGHVNNVVYYGWFDTAINAWLIAQGVLDLHQGQTIGLVVQSHCDYFAPLAFPQAVQAGIRVAKRGKSSVRYEIGLFADGQTISAAQGYFVHVYVDKTSRQPVPLPEAFISVLEQLS